MNEVEMRDNEIRQLIKLLEENEGIGEIEMSIFPFGGKKIRVARHGAGQIVTAAPAPAPQAAPASSSTTDSTPEAKSHLHPVKAPMVGTFYRSPNPESDPFISEGSKIAPGTVLCIVEAMKLLNEIESDVGGIVREILVENGQAVEFGQPLFLIEKL